MVKLPFKKIIIEGEEVSLEMLRKYTELEKEAYFFGMVVDPETLKIVPMREQTKQWPEGDRLPSDNGWDKE